MSSSDALPGWPLAESPFHEGERAIHTRLGFADRAEQVGRRMIRAAMPDQHRELFAELPFVVVGSLDADGRPWASLLAGAKGFVSSPDPYTLAIAALPMAGDPLGAAIRHGRPLGLLGIQLQTRRRNRMNGRIGEVTQQGFTLHVDQSFGNCPKYITPRTPRPRGQRAGLPQVPSARAESAWLSASALACIAAADTCFIASASAAATSGSDDPREGVDVSHRGGPPGFVKTFFDEARTTLVLPDYVGNNMFNTLGNLLVYPHAGLLFVDFALGSLVMLTGHTQVLWEGPEVEALEGAQRLIRFEVDAGLTFENVLPPHDPPGPRDAGRSSETK